MTTAPMATSSMMPPPTRRAMVVLFISMASEVLEDLLDLDVFFFMIWTFLMIWTFFDMCLHHELAVGFRVVQGIHL